MGRNLSLHLPHPQFYFVQQNKKLIEKEKSEMTEIQNESGGDFSCTNFKFVANVQNINTIKKEAPSLKASFFNTIIW